MSFLAPLFFAGLAAIAVPILVHLIQRERKTIVEFPSLMFIRKIPYQSVERRRIHNWLLLLMRVAAMVLLIAAFARPFFNVDPVKAATALSGAREVVIMLDRSASMGYGDHWAKAKAEATKVANSIGGEDKATLVLFGTGAEEAVRATAGTLSQHALRVDVSRRDEVERMIAAATENLGPVDILVNNAGVYRNTPMQDLTESEFDRMLAVNLKSVLFGIQAVTPQMIARRSGSIVNVASVAARLGALGTMAYSVAKAGVVQLTNVAAIELAPHNVRVNALGPGTFATEMSVSAYADPAMEARVLSRIPLGRTGRPEEAAGVALFLASDDASYVTGKTIYADGGRMGLNLTM